MGEFSTDICLVRGKVAYHVEHKTANGIPRTLSWSTNSAVLHLPEQENLQNDNIVNAQFPPPLKTTQASGSYINVVRLLAFVSYVKVLTRFRTLVRNRISLHEAMLRECDRGHLQSRMVNEFIYLLGCARCGTSKWTPISPHTLQRAI